MEPNSKFLARFGQNHNAEHTLYRMIRRATPWNYNMNRNKKIPCYMSDSACRRRIIKKAEIF